MREYFHTDFSLPRREERDYVLPNAQPARFDQASLDEEVRRAEARCAEIQQERARQDQCLRSLDSWWPEMASKWGSELERAAHAKEIILEAHRRHQCRLASPSEVEHELCLANTSRIQAQRAADDKRRRMASLRSSGTSAVQVGAGHADRQAAPQETKMRAKRGAWRMRGGTRASGNKREPDAYNSPWRALLCSLFG